MLIVCSLQREWVDSRNNWSIKVKEKLCEQEAKSLMVCACEFSASGWRREHLLKWFCDDNESSLERGGNRRIKETMIQEVSTQEHTVDALPQSGDEGRGYLRKATGNRKHMLIRGCPNGATQLESCPVTRKRANPENWNILVPGGKESKNDFVSSGERTRNSLNRSYVKLEGVVTSVL